MRPRKSETYKAVHKRLRTDRGRAGDQNCSCGSPAREWAYQYTSEDERVDPLTGRKYSLDVNDYDAMCISCHRKFDHRQDPKRHQYKLEAARQRMIAINKDPRFHEQRVENSRANGRKVIAEMREAGTLQEFVRKGGKASHR